MAPNVLITGGAGYIGGTVIADLLSRNDGPLKGATFTAAVRSADAIPSLKSLGINVAHFELEDEAAAKDVVLNNQIDIVVHTASSIAKLYSENLIKALGERRKATGKDVYFVHASLTTLYAEEAGWPYGQIRDDDAVYEKEAELGGAHPVRENDIRIIELSKELGVTPFIVSVPNVYGVGTGQWRKLSVQIPALVRASIKLRTVYRFDKEATQPAAHVEDLANLYTLIVEKVVQGEPIPSGERGYYFAMAHRSPMRSVAEGLATSLYRQGLVDSAEVKVWPSDQKAAEELGFPVRYTRAMCTSSPDIVPVNAFKLGWQPRWTEKRHLDSMDEEVQSVLDLDRIKPSVFNNL